MALASAALWGAGDFSGGMGVGAAGGKISSALRVVMLSHFSSLVVLVLIVLLRHESVPSGPAMAWGLLAGVCAAVSLTCFYTALSRGTMGASAVISGLLAASIPAGVSVVVDGAPSVMKFAGFLVAAVAIWMIAAGPAQPADEHAGGTGRSTVTLAVVAGLGFGVYFTALRMANPLGIFMPMALARLASLVVCGVAFAWVAWRGHPGGGEMTGKAAAWAVGAGALDTVGNLLFIGSTRAGRLDVAAVLASLYPASTIVLARWVLKEGLGRRQMAGMLVALAAVLMITL